MASLYRDAQNTGAPIRTEDSIFLEKELETMLNRIVEDVRPELEWEVAANATSEAGAGTATIAYKEISTGGRMAPNNGSLGDVPRVTAKAKRVAQNSLGFIIGAGWTNQEVRAAMKANASLTDVYLRAAVRAYRETVNDMFLVGSPDDGVEGILVHKRIPRSKMAVTIGSTGPSAAADIREAILNFIDGRLEIAVERADGPFAGGGQGKILTMASDAYRYVRRTILDGTNRITIKQEIEAQTGVMIVEGQNLGAANMTAAKTGLGAAYNFMMLTDMVPDHGQLHIPMPLMEVEGGIRHNGVEYIQLWEAEIAGFIPYQPRRFAVAYGF